MFTATTPSSLIQRPRVATVSVAYLKLVLEQARRIGIDCQSIPATVGLTKDMLHGDGRIPDEKAYRVWKELESRSESDILGLQLAQGLPKGAFAVLDYVVRNAETIEAACRHFVRYSKLVHTGAEVRFRTDEQRNEAMLSYMLRSADHPLPKHAAQFTVAVWTIVARQITHESFSPSRVLFQHKAPAITLPYTQLFRCPVLFSQQTNAMVLSGAACTTPVSDADPRLQEVMDRYANELLQRIPNEDTFRALVYQLVGHGLRTGNVTLEHIASKTAMSPRTLQRRLTALGTSFQGLVDEVRLGLAKQYLGDPSVSMSEACFLLGFSEPSAFHRAFKRWTGATPGEFRKLMLSTKSN